MKGNSFSLSLLILLLIGADATFFFSLDNNNIVCCFFFDAPDTRATTTEWMSNPKCAFNRRLFVYIINALLFPSRQRVRRVLHFFFFTLFIWHWALVIQYFTSFFSFFLVFFLLVLSSFRNNLTYFQKITDGT